MNRSIPGLAWIRNAFLALGVLAILAGLGTALYAIVDLRPRVAAVTTELRLGLRDAGRITDAVGEHRHLAARTLDMLQQGQSALAAVPSALGRTRQLLVHASATTEFTVRAIGEIEGGVTGLVAPDADLERTRLALTGTVGQMRELAEELAELEAATGRFAGSLDRLTGDLAEVSAFQAPEAPLLAGARERTERLEDSLAYLDLPRQTAFAGAGLGALFFALGLIALALAVGTDQLMTALSTDPRDDGIDPDLD